MKNTTKTHLTQDESSVDQFVPIGTDTSRRQFIQSVALSCLGLVTADVIAGSTATERKPGGPVRKGQILSEPQMKLLRDLVEIIIPKTDTSGAADTDTHGFIDDQLANCQAPEEAEQFIEGLDQFALLVKSQWGEEFSGLNSSEQHAAMTAFAQKTSPFDTLPEGFFRQLKALTIIGYYSSEIGATRELVYLPVPGGYQGDFPVSGNDGKAFVQRRF